MTPRDEPPRKTPDTGPPGFAVLDPRRDPASWERLVRRITAAAAPELARRAAEADVPRGVLVLLSEWRRPALSAAAALAAAAATVLLLAGGPAAAGTAPGIADALGSPDPVAAWVESDAPPSLEELVAALEGDGTR